MFPGGFRNQEETFGETKEKPQYIYALVISILYICSTYCEKFKVNFKNIVKGKLKLFKYTGHNKKVFAYNCTLKLWHNLDLPYIWDIDTSPNESLFETEEVYLYQLVHFWPKFTSMTSWIMWIKLILLCTQLFFGFDYLLICNCTIWYQLVHYISQTCML